MPGVFAAGASPADIGEPDLVLLDLPYNGDQWVNDTRCKGKPVVALDYEGTVSPDLIISIFDRGEVPACARHLVGLDYAIIRPDIRVLRPTASATE